MASRSKHLKRWFQVLLFDGRWFFYNWITSASEIPDGIDLIEQWPRIRVDDVYLGLAKED